MSPQTENDHPPRRAESPSGDLISLLLAILLVTGILLGLFLYAKRWKEKKDAATCVMNIRNFQTAARSYASVMHKEARPSDPVEASAVYKFVGPSHYMSTFTCPSRGTYSVHNRYGAPPGTVFLRCSHPKHQPTPAQSANW